MKANLNSDVPGRTSIEWWIDNKERLKELNKVWRENNKEYLNQKMKDYRKDNKEKFKEYEKKRSEKITCEICNSVVGKRDIARHKKSQKCINAKK